MQDYFSFSVFAEVIALLPYWGYPVIYQVFNILVRLPLHNLLYTIVEVVTVERGRCDDGY
jgi:hypothetical protein